METKEVIRLFNISCGDLVETFSKEYWFDRFEEIWYQKHSIPWIFEFDNWYQFTLMDIYSALSYKISKSDLIERKELTLDSELWKKNKNISLLNFAKKTNE